MLNKIGINNYKSLKRVEVPLGPLTVLVGPNNAGKSNIRDCFRFLQDLLDKREGAVSYRGGFHRIIHNGDLKERIRFVLSGTSGIHTDVDYNYALELSGRDYTNYEITLERLFAQPHLFNGVRWVSGAHAKLGINGRALLEFPNKDGQAEIFAPDGTALGGGGQDKRSSYLSWWNDMNLYPIVGEFAQDIKNWGFNKIEPSSFKQPVQIIKQLRLSGDGSNTASVLHLIHSEYPDAFRQIEEYLKIAVPELDELRTELSEGGFGHTYIAIKEKGLRDSIPSLNMSDGTLKLIALMVILLNPKPSPLICIEEPENYLHPGLMEFLAHVLKQASDKTQVLVTTHSPYLLNYLNPENVLIVTKKDGATQVRPMKETKGLQEALKVLGLGEVWLGDDSLGGATPVEE